MPVPNCTSPTIWLPLAAGNQGIVLIDGANLNTQLNNPNSIEVVADIETTMQVYSDPTNSTAVAFSTGYICYTPLGRAYVNVGSLAQPVFDGVLPSVGVVEVKVTRATAATGGMVRSVLLPPSGMARLFSHT